MKSFKKIIALALFLFLSLSTVGKVNYVNAETHVHGASCYNGTLHIHEGKPTIKAGCYQGTRTSKRCNGLLSRAQDVEYEYSRDNYCNYCNTSQGFRSHSCRYYMYCNNCKEDVVTKIEVDCSPQYNNQYYTSEYDDYGYETGVRYHSVTTYTYALSCGLDGVYVDSQNNPTSTICNKVVTSLVGKK